MILNYKHWKNIFLIGLGIFLAAAFCMKWIEPDLLHKGDIFTIIGLEIVYPKEKIVTIFSEIDPQVRSILGYHLTFDFIFMIGVYPGIAALCLMVREKIVSRTIRKVLATAALLQIVAFGCDIIENYYLLKWLATPQIDSEFLYFHFVVAVKWLLVITALLIVIPIEIKQRLIKNEKHFLI